MQLLCSVVWFILPAGLANIAPVLAARLLPTWNARLDGGRSFRGVRILGDHKTLRGLLAGMLVATLVFAAQQALWTRVDLIRSWGIIDYATMPVWFGTLMGFGALFGDMVKSFFKRRVGRKPGAPWFPFDQIDWMVGALACTWPIARPTVLFGVVAVGASIVLSLAVKGLGYLIGLDDKPI